MSTQDARSSDREKEKEDDRDNDRNEDSHDVTDDTPIVVGGGGSTYVWILKTLVPAPSAGMPPGTLLPIADPHPHYPIDAGSYYCYDIQVNLGRYRTHDGVDEGNSHPVKDRLTHRTRFYREVP